MNQTSENGQKPNFGSNFGPNLIFPKNFGGWGALPLLDVRHCRKLSSYAISKKNYDPNLRE